MLQTNLSCREVLESLTFGHRIAEDERESLAKYFVQTDQWRRVYRGEVDIIYGAKGAGKSALYFLLLSRGAELEENHTRLITAENPRGATVFRDLTVQPPASERQFIELWKLYFLSLVGKELKAIGAKDRNASRLVKLLEESQLLEPEGGLTGLLRGVIDYIKRVKTFEGGVNVDATTGAQSFTGKILFEEPTPAQRLAGVLSLDDLFELANASLELTKQKIWILLDRLDVAFAETPDLEKNAIRALFKSYRDMQTYGQIQLKIFLRTDIWRRVTDGGFREGSHIAKAVTITWTRSSLLNLIVLRSLQNEKLTRFYGIVSNAHLSAEMQLALFNQMFPERVDSGAKKSLTLDWLLGHTKDGTQDTAPRELIHLLNSIRDVQYRKLELGESEPPARQLFTRAAIKEALPDVSRTRLTQTFYSENPVLKEYCEKLIGEKTKQTPETLAAIWNCSLEEATSLGRQLVETGFFEQRGQRDSPEFWVPFLYRGALEMIQGTATE